jgi:hypothetical protein
MARLSLNEIKSKFETGDRPTGSDYADLIETLSAQATDLGTAGNNEIEITGLDSETIIDSFSSTDWRFVKYMVSLSAVSGGQNKFSSTEFTVLIDQDNININEYGSLDNDGDIGTVIVSKGIGVISLIVTPNPSFKPVTIRFARVGLKA